MRRTGLLLAAVATLAIAGVGSAGETARQILDRRKALDDTAHHWDDRHEHMKLTISDRRGSERVRELDLYERKYPGDEQKSIVFFQTPAEVKGTAFLAFTHKGRPADQWLYLPELKRVRQITARSRSESFVGTDLSYHDLDLLNEMVSWTENDATSSLHGTEVVDGVQCWVIDLAAQREDIGYKHVRLWLGQDDLVPRRIEFYEDGDQPKKRLTQSAVKTIGTIPTPHRIDVETPSAGSRTAVEIADVQFNQKLEDDLFTERALERGKR
jgi:outer membrane lipoprotein-sorting protein